MKYKYTLLRLIGLILVAGLLAGYRLNLYLEARDREVKGLKAQVDQLTRERDEFLDRFTASSGQDSGENGKEPESQTAAGEAGDAGGLYKDGTYQGTGTGYGGEIKVSAVIENEKLAAVDIVSAEGEDEAYLSIGKDIIYKMIDAQSAEVDTISGATYSSTGIREAVAEALEEAKK